MIVVKRRFALNVRIKGDGSNLLPRKYLRAAFCFLEAL